MITRSNFNGIDKEMFAILESLFETLSPRMIYHNNNDIFHEMEKRLTEYHELDGTIDCEFERQGEKVSIQLSNHSLVIKFVTNNVIQDDNTFAAPLEDEIEIYQYTYVNTNDNPEVFEEGDFEYFSIKIHELCNGIDIDAIILSKKA